MVKNRINAWINSARINSWVSGGGGGGFGYLGSYAQTLSMLNGFGSAFGNFGWSRTATGWTTSDPIAIYVFMSYASRNNPSIGEMNMFINNYMHGNGGGKLFRSIGNFIQGLINYKTNAMIGSAVIMNSFNNLAANYTNADKVVYFSQCF